MSEISEKDKTGKERRKHPRQKIKIKVEYKTVDKFRSEYTNNISHGGIFVKTKNPLPLHSTVDISFSIPSLKEPVIIAAEVVRAVSEKEANGKTQFPGFALEFKDFKEKKKKMDEILKKLTTEDLEMKRTIISLGPPEAKEKDKKAEVSDEKGDDGEDKERVEHRTIQIKNMSVKEKMMLAPKADRIERAALLRDLNPSVARLIIRNPRITESDIARIAKDVSAPADVLKAIVKNRKWISNADIKIAIVRNPRTPTQLALRQMNFLSTNELSSLAKSQHVRDTIKREALKLLLKRRESGK
jgi:uncharacterized protein (TIGR02266 family)